jgi:integrase
MASITVKAANSAKVTSGEKYISDGDGLYLRVRPGATAKIWFFRYTFQGKTRKIQLGVYPHVGIPAARAAANKLHILHNNGKVDPIAAKESESAEALAELEAHAEAQRAAREAAQQEAAKIDARMSVHKLFERWMAVDLVRRKDGGAEVRRMFEKDVLPTLGSLAVEDVRKGHITGVTDALLARGVTRMAKLIFSLIRQMFRFAVDRDIIEFEPTAAIRKAKIGGKDTERDRVLSEDEIRALVQKLPTASLSCSTETAVWLALSTCCRIGELLGARWEHIDFEKHIWWVPPENSKNGKAHTIYLSNFALEQFQRVKDSASETVERARLKGKEASISPSIYPNRNGTGAVCPKTVTKQLGDRQRPGLQPMKGRAKVELSATLALKGGRWGPHDLRRTGATMMVALGVLPEVAERCLNHTEENKVKRIYQRHSYEAEMRQAWALLGDRLEMLTS